MVLNGEERLVYEVHVDRIHLECVSEFKYLGCVLDKSGTNGAECSRKVESRRRVAGSIRSLVNARELKFECARVLHEILLVPSIMYGSETMLWKENERSRVRALQMNNLRRLLGIRKMDRVPNGGIRVLSGIKKGLDERMDEECSGGLDIWRGWRGIGLPRESM